MKRTRWRKIMPNGRLANAFERERMSARWIWLREQEAFFIGYPHRMTSRRLAELGAIIGKPWAIDLARSQGWAS